MEVEDFVSDNTLVIMEKTFFIRISLGREVSISSSHLLEKRLRKEAEIYYASTNHLGLCKERK